MDLEVHNHKPKPSHSHLVEVDSEVHNHKLKHSHSHLVGEVSVAHSHKLKPSHSQLTIMAAQAIMEAIKVISAGSQITMMDQATTAVVDLDIMAEVEGAEAQDSEDVIITEVVVSEVDLVDSVDQGKHLKCVNSLVQ